MTWFDQRYRALTETSRAGVIKQPFMFLGFADYMSHERERPIAFVSRLRRG